MKLFFVRFVLFVILIFDSKAYWVSDDEEVSSDNGKLSTPEECARSCVEGEEPKTCYYQFTVEYFSTLSQACDLCRSNSTTHLVADCQCITSDGYEKTAMLTANRMYPGPAIMVCLRDYIVVDVQNRALGTGISIHWHGIFQNGYQYYDGVPFVTQCPINDGATFRYQWKANNPGTHFWHSHAGLQKGNGLEGSLIIRQPKKIEPNSELWDYDNLDNVIFITDMFHDTAEDHFPGTLVRRRGQLPDTFLINGLGQWTDPETGMTTTTPIAKFIVKANHRYRFRLINSCSYMCASQLTIEGHNLTVIATDGAPIKPTVVNSITSSSAERYDFVIHTDKKPATYWIQLRGLGGCTPAKMQQLALLTYKSAPKDPKLIKPSYEGGLDPGVIMNPLNVMCTDSQKSADYVCIDELKSAVEIPDNITKEEPDMRLYLAFGFHTYHKKDVFKPDTYKRFLAGNSGSLAGMVDNITNLMPPSPYLSQRELISNDDICSNDDSPIKCQTTMPCACYHMKRIPLNAIVELVLVDEAGQPGISHPFHMHGHAFYVIGQGRAIDHNITRISVESVKELDSKNLIERNLDDNPGGKDTFAIPNNGYSIVRFLANNPGYWLFHCHFEYHLNVGMSMVFHIGEKSDVPPVPEGFPQCANFVPPIKDPM